MSAIRQPAVAGSFYPADPVELSRMVTAQLGAADPGADEPRALIAPHAGYIYSGPIAASAYRQLAGLRDRVTRVLLLGPSHRVPFRGLAASSADAFRTPLGDIALDPALTRRLLQLPQVSYLDQAHALEHSLEVHLPFLQTVLDRFSLVPLVVGDATPEQVGEVIGIAWEDPATFVVVSSDLSHYHDYATARRMDDWTSRQIVDGRVGTIDGEHACGCRPVNGLLRAAAEHDLHARVLDLRSSGDTAGDPGRVVGYGAYGFY